MTAAAHPTALLARLHGGGGRGLICFSSSDAKGWRDSLVSTEEVFVAAATSWGGQDRYFSVAQFRPGRDRRRGNDRIMSFGGIAIDIDRPDVDAADLVAEVLACADKLEVPRPTGIVSTGGRGVHVYWCFDKRLPGRAAPRWRRLVKWLVEHFGADPACVDPARVLRLPGSVHGKTGRPCEIVFWSDETADFEALFERAAPLARSVLRAKRKMKKTAKGTARRRNERKRHSAFADLVRLAEAEGGFPEGQRNVACHIAASLLSRNLTGVDLEATVLGFGHAHTSLSDNEIRDSAISAARARRRDGRGYQYSLAGIRRKLKITEERAKRAGLVALVASPDRSAARKKMKRQRMGMRPQAQSRERAAPWRKAGTSRATYYRRRERMAAALKRRWADVAGRLIPMTGFSRALTSIIWPTPAARVFHRHAQRPRPPDQPSRQPMRLIWPTTMGVALTFVSECCGTGRRDDWWPGLRLKN